GYGGVLIAAAVDFLGSEGATIVRVATQGRNEAAQRTYQRAGFVTDSIRLWYHWWPGRAGDATSSEAQAGRSGE
ncbi:MAG TPA: GNAT family N-acetyltransferase, partial [Thermoanaerobaculia bacterium]|nr:GNAT family N-acetyltransferase [Thermoanaerobaculia bacterium]